MSQHGDSPEVLESARRTLADRDADLAEADRALAEAVAEAHAIAVESIGRIGAIGAEVDAMAVQAPLDSPAAARELSRFLVSRNRDIATVVSEAKAVADAKTLVLKTLIDRYR